MTLRDELLVFPIHVITIVTCGRKVKGELGELVHSRQIENQISKTKNGDKLQVTSDKPGNPPNRKVVQSERETEVSQYAFIGHV